MDNDKRKEERVRLTRQFFFRRWDEIIDVVDYDYNWQVPLLPRRAEKQRRKGMIDYSFDGIHQDPQFNNMPFGKIVKTMDDHGRKIIIVVTRLGLWLFYVGSIDVKKECLGSNRSRALHQFQPSPVTYTRLDLATYIGSPNGLSIMSKVVARNIGERIEILRDMMNDPTFRPPHSVFVTDASGKPLK